MPPDRLEAEVVRGNREIEGTMSNIHRVHRVLRRGYTLIEVLIVVTILGLAGALLVPYLSSKGDFDTQAAVRALIADITFAQSDALANQGFRRVHFFDDGTGWCLVRVAEDDLAEPFDPAVADYVYDPLASNAERGSYIVNLQESQRFSSVRVQAVDLDGGKRAITFDELGGTVGAGGLPGTGGRIVLTSPQATYQVDVSPVTGKVRVTRLAGAGNP
jgi:prepilin-type N-terminal cleavage/methylation domain-containing protein